MVIGTGGRVPPSENIDNDAFSFFEPDTDGLDFFESLEGMLVTVEDAVSVAGSNEVGDIYTVSNLGATASGTSERGTLTIAPDDFNPERICIDNGGLMNFSLPLVDTGAELGNITGVLSYSAGKYGVLPTLDFGANVVFSSPVSETSALTGTSRDLLIASYNVSSWIQTMLMATRTLKTAVLLLLLVILWRI